MSLAGQDAIKAAQASTDATGLATTAARIGEQIAQEIKAVFGGVFAFLAPIMGPAAAAPAAASAAVVASYDVGSWELPANMIAQVHQGEMIVPKSMTPWAQDLMSNAASSGGGEHYHDHFSPQIHVHAGKGVSEKELRQHGAVIADILKEQHRNGAFTRWRGKA